MVTFKLKLSFSFLDKIIESLLNIKYENVNKFISHLKTSTTIKSSPWRGCANPTTCFAFFSRHKEKTLNVNLKRKYVEDMTLPESTIATSKLKTTEKSIGHCVIGTSHKTKTNVKTNKFFVSCRIRGQWRTLLKPFLLSKLIANNIFNKNKTWVQVTEKPDLNLYFNLNDECIFAGM